MLLKLDNIQPITSQVQTVDLAALSICYHNHSTNVFWIGIRLLPSDEEVDLIIASLVTALSTSRLILHFEHVSHHPLDNPSFEMMKKFVSTLINYKKLLSENLIGTIFQARILDHNTKVMRDLFLSLYKPLKPLLFTDNSQEVECFVNKLLAT